MKKKIILLFTIKNTSNLDTIIAKLFQNKSVKIVIVFKNIRCLYVRNNYILKIQNFIMLVELLGEFDF